MEKKAFDLEMNSSAPDTPLPNDILSLKLLKDTNEKVFKPLYQEQSKYLALARTMLLQDEWLKTKFNGAGLSSCSALAKILKKRSNEIHMEQRIDPFLEIEVKQAVGSGGLKKPDVSKIIKIKEGKLKFNTDKISESALDFEDGF